jgi:hypothetical protein
MPIYQALQLAYRAAQFKLRGLHGGDGSDQILGGAHLVDALRREQRETRSRLLLKQLAESGSRADANPPQGSFGQSFLTR